MKGLFELKTLVRISLLGAIATILMLFEFPIIFIAPVFYKMDFSEVPVLIGGLIMGPLVGCVIELIKILLNFLINGTVTAGVGEFANFIIGSSLVIPTCYVYRKYKSPKALLVALVIGVLIMTMVGTLMNYFVLLPLYAQAFQMPLQAFIDMGHAINARIIDLRGFVLIAVVPFNLVKGVLVSLVTFIIFRRIRDVLV